MDTMITDKEALYHGQQLLLIAPVFFEYYKDIMSEAEGLGFAVDFFCDAPSNSNLSKALGRINKSLIVGAAKSYFFQQVFPTITAKAYDVVLIVGGMTFAFSPEQVQKIREAQPQAQCLLYQWDSEKNLPYAPGIHPYFNKIYSFDRRDCKRDAKYSFLPLFYSRLYENAGQKAAKYDCSYIGTAHPKKYADITRISDALRPKLPKQYIYHYMPSMLKYLYQKVTSKEFRSARHSQLHSKKMSAEDTMRIFEDSKIILDAPQAGQTGLTIRTIECLGARKKMITTNEDIVNYDFYDERNILIFRGEIDWSSPFFREKYRNPPEEIYSKYALRNWLQHMLEEGNDKN